MFFYRLQKIDFQCFEKKFIMQPLPTLTFLYGLDNYYFLTISTTYFYFENSFLTKNKNLSILLSKNLFSCNFGA